MGVSGFPQPQWHACMHAGRVGLRNGGKNWGCEMAGRMMLVPIRAWTPDYCKSGGNHIDFLADLFQVELGGIRYRIFYSFHVCRIATWRDGRKCHVYRIATWRDGRKCHVRRVATWRDGHKFRSPTDERQTFRQKPGTSSLRLSVKRVPILGVRRCTLDGNNMK